jgi:hypothetical protein
MIHNLLLKNIPSPTPTPRDVIYILSQENCLIKRERAKERGGIERGIGKLERERERERNIETITAERLILEVKA